MRVFSPGIGVAGTSEKRISGLLKSFMRQSGEDITFPKRRFAWERIVKEKKYPGMYRVRWTDGSLSDMVNHARAKEAVNEFRQYQKAQANPSS